MFNRFINKVLVDPITGCHNWIAYIRPDGYGDFRMGEKKEIAHRAAWLLLVGDIPDDLWVLHHCDNRKCVNPDHLYLGTHEDNMQDVVDRKRRKGICIKEGNGLAILIEEEVKEIRDKYATGKYSQEVLAEEYFTCSSNIGCIVRGETW